MEPVDPPMGGLLDGAGAAGPDELRSIVSKAGRRRNRLAAAAAGLALAAGAGIGYGVASATGGGSGQQIVATAPVSGASGSSAAEGAAPAVGGASMVFPSSKFESLFTRRVGSIDIRGFLLSLPSPLPYQGIYACGFGGPRFQAEVSSPHMVGIVDGFVYQDQTAGPIIYSQPSVIGQPEGAPTSVVVAYTSPNVAQVKMDFVGGSSDSMAPVQGWSALAAPTASDTSSANPVYGTLTAYDHAGKVLQSVSVEGAKPPVPPPVSGGATGSGTANSGSIHAAGGGIASPPATTSTAPPATSSGTTTVTTLRPQGNIAYPCKVSPGPASPPTCAPPTTVKGAGYACATPVPEPLPAQVCSQPTGSSATCAPAQVPPITPGTNTASPNSGSGG